MLSAYPKNNELPKSPKPDCDVGDRRSIPCLPWTSRADLLENWLFGMLGK
jgi:hypothetical protein